VITLHRLELLRAVCRAGSLNRAAKSVHLSQSTLSQHIRELEASVGAPLFVRSSRGVRPTAAGELLDEVGGQVLDLLAQAQASIAALAPGSRHLAVVATPGVSVYVLPPHLAEFRRENPGVGVSLETALTDEVVREVLAGQHDLGVVEGDLRELDTEDLDREALRTVRYKVVVGAGHPWRDRRSVPLGELVNEPFLQRPRTSRARRWLEAQLGPQARRLRVVAELDSPSAITHALLAGSGVSVLPDYAVEREVRLGELIELDLEGHDLQRPLLAVWDARTAGHPLRQALVAGLRATDTRGAT